MYKYTIKFRENGECREEWGIIHATHLGDAAKRICEFYGEYIIGAEHTEVLSLDLYELEEVLTEDDLRTLID